jgi:dimethylargininase
MVHRDQVALTRPVSRSLGRCELTHLERQRIDVDRARRQHAAYERALQDCGLLIHRLPEAPDLPDSVFVEDTAVVVDELAVVTRPGAVSRRREVSVVATALAGWRPVVRIEPPATLDGGDVLRVGNRIWVGRSSRTDPRGIEQLTAALTPYGYRVDGVEVHGCLHLKSAVTAVGDRAVLVNPAWVDDTVFEDLERIEVDPSEPAAANALWTGSRVIYAAAYPRTAARLVTRGLDLEIVEVDELAKAEGAVTCCSVVLSLDRGAM